MPVARRDPFYDFRGHGYHYGTCRPVDTIRARLKGAELDLDPFARRRRSLLSG
jgi:hypothetical protein